MLLPETASDGTDPGLGALYAGHSTRKLKMGYFSFLTGSDLDLDPDLDLARAVPRHNSRLGTGNIRGHPEPVPRPMEATEFLKVLLILSVLNSVCTLVRALSFAFAGMAAARKTHEKLLGRWAEGTTELLGDGFWIDTRVSIKLTVMTGISS